MAKIYLPHQIEVMSDKAARKAYSELRKVANKRLARLEKADLGGYGAFRYATLDMIHPDDVKQELAEVSRFIRDPRHTVRGAKKYRSTVLDVLHSKYPNMQDVNESNFKEWANYMEFLRDRYKNKLFDSGDATDVFIEAERLNLPKSIIENHYTVFRNNIDVIKNIDSITNTKKPGAPIRFTDFKNAIEQAKKK